MNHNAFIVKPGSKVSLNKQYDPGYKANYQQKSDAEGKLEADIQRLAYYQDVLYAQNTYALLIIFQAMDAAGKDSTIKHVMSGDIICTKLQALNLKYPTVSEEHQQQLLQAKQMLESED